MSSISKPNTFSANTSISSSQVNANFDTIYNDYNGNISEANLADDAVTTDKIANDAVTAAKIVNGSISNAKLNTSTGELGGAWQSWTPTLSGLFTNGDWTKTACRYRQIGKTVEFRLVLISTDASPMGGAGDPIFTLPVTSVATPSTLFPIGFGTLCTTSTFKDPGVALWTSTTTASIRRYDANNDGNTLSSTSPFTWGVGYQILLTGVYEAA